MNKLTDFFNENKRTQGTAGKSLVVKAARCPQNHPCPSVRVCPVGALTQRGVSAPDVSQDKCIKCGKCVSFCPMRALVLE